MDDSGVSENQTSLSQIYEWKCVLMEEYINILNTNINTKYFSFWKSYT